MTLKNQLKYVLDDNNSSFRRKAIEYGIIQHDMFLFSFKNTTGR